MAFGKFCVSKHAPKLAGTALDFREFKKLRDGIGKEDAYGNVVTGYDYNFVLRNDTGDAP